MISELDIVRGCIRGDKKLQKMLYDRFAPKMMGVCIRYFTNIGEAEDALQEGFIRVFTNLKSFRKEGALESWIRKIIINTTLNYYRSNLKHRYHFDIQEMEENIEDRSVTRDVFDVKDLLKMIHNLPEGYRIVFNLYEMDGYNHKEIADMLKISTNTSKSQLLKARKLLQKMMVKLNPQGI